MPRLPTSVALVACLVGGAAVVVPLGFGRAAGTLSLELEAPIRYPPIACPVGTPAGLACFARTGAGVVRGLGRVEESYAYVLDEGPVGCPADAVRGLESTARLTVPGKGAIYIRVGGTACLTRIPPAPVRGTESFTVTGGSGRYSGASGSGTIAHVSNGPDSGWSGTDTWGGTIVVPGVEFDLTPPTITGATNRVVRAPHKATRVRVRFTVTASDDVDGSVGATCKPKSGGLFGVGRATVVRCSATDSSANTAAARFVVTVRRR